MGRALNLTRKEAASGQQLLGFQRRYFTGSCNAPLATLCGSEFIHRKGIA
jgi:hypothetical protein